MSIDTTLCNRRQFVFGAAATAAGFSIHLAQAQDFPTRLIRLVLGFPAGSGVDIVARLIAPSLSARLEQPVIIENRPGAGSNIATAAVVRAPPDGHTLLWIGPPVAINATLYENLSYVFLRDIVPVAGINREPSIMMVSAASDIRSIPELIARAKVRPGQLNFVSVGVGSASHIAGEYFKAMAGIDMVHVPYTGGPAAITDLIAGRVDLAFFTPSPTIELIRSGQLRPIGVGTATRFAGLPDVPTISDFLPGFEASYFYGLGCPKDTPAAIVYRLNATIAQVLDEPVVSQRLQDLGATPLNLSPQHFRELIEGETAKWGQVIKSAGIKIAT